MGTIGMGHGAWGMGHGARGWLRQSIDKPFENLIVVLFVNVI
jgi:hypothetical protein